MSKLVFITQQVDPAHPALAATVPKIRALAELVDEIVVLADDAVEGVLPANCRVRTFRAGHKATRGARFEASLTRELGGLRGGAVVAHMCPIYAVLAAPLVRPLRVPLVLWFTHWRASRLLQAAERVSTAVTSVDDRSFPLPSRKVRAIGHGIDLEEFPCAPPREGEGTRLLALGRYSTAKGLDVVLAADGAIWDRRSSCACTARRSRTRSGFIATSSSSCRRSSISTDGSCSEKPCLEPSFPRSSRPTTLS